MQKFLRWMSERFILNIVLQEALVEYSIPTVSIGIRVIIEGAIVCAIASHANHSRDEL